MVALIPFIFTFLDDYAFYNPSKKDKGRREINFILKNKLVDRLKGLREIMSKDEDYWKFRISDIKIE